VSNEVFSYAPFFPPCQLSWVNLRIHFLQTIVHQKMGLFHHLPTEPTLMLVNSSAKTKPAPSSLVAPSLPASASASPNPLQMSPSSMQQQQQQQQQQPGAGPAGAGSTNRVRPDNIDALTNVLFPHRSTATAVPSLASTQSSMSLIPDRLKAEKKPSGDLERDKERRSKKRVRRVIELKNVLRFGFPEHPIHKTQLNSISDLVQRYGAQFKEVLHCELEQAKSEDNFQALYNKWTLVDKERIESADLRDLLNTVRLTHTCRAPLLFSGLRDSFFVQTGDSFYCTSAVKVVERARSPSTQQPPMTTATAKASGEEEDPSIKWYRHLMETFLKEYVEYLKSLGLTLAHQTDLDQHDATHTMFSVSETLSLPVKRMYLVKVYRVGFLLVEAGLDGGFGYANLYTLSQKSAFNQLSIEKEGGVKYDFRNLSLTAMKLFHEECAKFKNYTHINSFVYDFHLRYFQSFLVDHKREFPPMDFLEILRGDPPIIFLFFLTFLRRTFFLFFLSFCSLCPVQPVALEVWQESNS